MSRGDVVINIAICDDNQSFLESIFVYVEHYLLTYKEKHHIELFSSGREFLDRYNKNALDFDMILLDIDMPDINGIEIAEKIRELNQAVLIIFLTGMEKYVYDAFRYNAFRFIRKCDIVENLESCLREGINQIKKEQKQYAFKTEEGLVKLLVKDILYFDLVSRHIEVHTWNKTYITTDRRMKDVEALFLAEEFVKLHRGCIVNMKYIKSIDGQRIILDNKEELVASRYRVAEVLEKFMRYIG